MKLHPRDLERAVDAWGLPPEARALTLGLVRRARLRRGERLELADELASHFDEGLACGVPIGTLIDQFGDTATCASALRAAVIARRSRVDRVAHAILGITAPALAVLVVLYSASAVWLAQQQPHITMDLEAALVALPSGIDSALAQLVIDPALARDPLSNRLLRAIESNTADSIEARAAIESWLGQHSTAISRMRTVGCGGTGGPPGGTVVSSRSIAVAVDALSIDLWNAAAAGDGTRVLEDATAIDALSRRAGDPRSLVGWASAAALRVRALRVLACTLAHRVESIAPEILEGLRASPLLAAEGRELLSLALSGERLRLDDHVQRHFTDDGAGSGVALPTDRDVSSLVAAPLLALTLPSRRDTQAAADRLFLDIAMVAVAERPEHATWAATRLKHAAQSAVLGDPFTLVQSLMATIALRANDLRGEVARLRSENHALIVRALDRARADTVR